jgi:hypothetical protein
MSKYLVEVTHTQRECVWALKQLLDAGPEFLARFEWGCMDGEHVGWTFFDAESKFAAQEIVPRVLRPKARIIELSRFSPEQVRVLHETPT